MDKQTIDKKDYGSFTPFIKEVGSYFMEFLETDFHKRKLPRRSIKLHNERGLLSGVNISKYPTFYKVAYKLINNCFSDNILRSVQKGIFKAEIPKYLLELIKMQVSKLSDANVAIIVKELDEAIQQSAIKYKDDYLQAYNSVMTDADSVFKKRIIVDLIKNIEKPLASNNLADENTIFQIEEELTSIFKNKIEGAVSEGLKQRLSGNISSTKTLFKEVLDTEDIRTSLTKYFDMFKVSDLFTDLHELYQNFKIEDKQEFYFYFYDISYKKNKYPVFYIPFSIERKEDVFLITFDSQMYINKKALAYIVQEYNLERGTKGALETISDRIIYLSEHEKDLHLVLQETLTEITNFFNLDGKIQIVNPDIQTKKNLYLSVSTNIYVALFDKSDEALLNDYEDILNAPEDSSLMQGFQVLIEDFIKENPDSIQLVIADEWNEKDCHERLVCKSPIPLNGEQQQIISAINNDRCKYLLVEGPPGTGKSHTITAIVFDTILKDKSVLVISDKKEALDVVEKNIVNTLNKVRVDEKFQNPLLRLGKTGNTYSQLLTQSSIDGITEHFMIVRSKYPNISEQIDTAIDNLRRGVEAQVLAYKEISLGDVNELVSLKKYFDKEGYCIDVDEAVKESDSVQELTLIRATVLNLKKKISGNKDILFDFKIKKELSKENSQNLDKIISDLEKIENLVSKNPHLLQNNLLVFYISLVLQNKPKIDEIIKYSTDVFEIATILGENDEYLNLIGIRKNELNSLTTLREAAQYTLSLKNVISKVRYFAKNTLHLLDSFSESYDKDKANLESYINVAKELRSFLFGFFGKKKKVDQINQDFRKNFTFSKLVKPHHKLDALEETLGIYKYIYELKRETSRSDLDFIHIITSLLKKKELFFSEDKLNLINKSLEGLLKTEMLIKDLKDNALNVSTIYDLNIIIIAMEIISRDEEICRLITLEKELIDQNIDLKKNESLNHLLQENNINELIKETKTLKEYVDFIIESKNDFNYLKEKSNKYKDSFIAAGIDITSFRSCYENKLAKISDIDFGNMIRLITLNRDLISKFDGIKDLSYGERTKQIENIVTMQMTYLMDERFVTFTNTYKNDARSLKQIIKDKKKFPKEQFSKLKNAFPCILAGIRDYAEYIPLETDIFDLVIIDEASQVSIAQALPALLRAKKVVVLGDNLQFSNVKSALARGDINKQHLATLKDVFLKNVSSEAVKVVRMEKFNIKVSILDFFEFINNYKTRLKKHFRGYRELISYSNKTFYDDSLQVMKVRGVPISSVIKFSQVNHDGLEEVEKNTNVPEIDFIIAELKALKTKDVKCTVGIITPHTNQQSLLVKKISDLPEAEYFFDELKLKIMTFDTCQGEERDIIFYSMVATKTDDKLNYVFITNLNNIDLDDDEGKIKAQRLNVGLSRARECMHFVLSKPIDQYTGTVKEFLQHYWNTLQEGKKELDSSAVDKKSKMEPLILDWFYQTKFWKENKDVAEIIPQFELGKYLRQLDKSYIHPNYRVDFLLVYNDNGRDQHKLILEYDGFLEHFGDSTTVVNESNYQEYYSPEDVYRQHVLEGYDYKFIRINKFNLGKNPIATLDSRINEVVKKKHLTMNY